MPEIEAAMEAEMTKLQNELDAAADGLAQAQDLADEAADNVKRAQEFAEIERRETILAIAEANKLQAEMDKAEEQQLQGQTQAEAEEQVGFFQYMQNLLTPPPSEEELAAKAAAEQKKIDDEWQAGLNNLYTLPNYQGSKPVHEAFMKRERAKRAFLLANQRNIWDSRTNNRPVLGITWFDVWKYYDGWIARDMTQQWPKPVLGAAPNPNDIIPFVFEGTTYNFRRDGDFRTDTLSVPPCNDTTHKNANGAPYICKEGQADDIYSKYSMSGDRIFKPCKGGYFFEESVLSEQSMCIYIGSGRYADTDGSYYAESKPVEYFITY